MVQLQNSEDTAEFLLSNAEVSNGGAYRVPEIFARDVQKTARNSAFQRKTREIRSFS